MPLKLVSYYAGNVIPDMPGTDTFHSDTLFHLFEATPGYYPILTVAYDNGRVVAKLLATIRKSVRAFPPAFIRRCEVYGTGEYFIPLQEQERVFALMLSHLTKTVLNKVFLIEFRNLNSAMFGYRAFKASGYFPINWLRVRNSLHDIPHAETRFSPSRIRQIKKGMKNGATVREVQTTEEVKALARLLHHIYSWKVRRHFPSMKFFQNMEKQMVSGKKGRIFIVSYKGKIIGGSACIYSGDTAYLWFSGGMRKTHAMQYPGVLSVWKAIHDAWERQYRHLEFLDVGLPYQKHGYRNFILRFGGKQISTRRWFKFRWTWLNNLLQRLYR